VFKKQWILLGAATLLPYLLLGLAGAYWLYETGWWLWWGALAAGISLLAWPATRWLQRRQAPPVTLAADADWSPVGRAAWQQVEQLAVQYQQTAALPTRPEEIWQTLHEVLQVVAREFHPRSRDPVLEIPVPHLLRIVELVAADLRDAISRNVPGSHILTIHDLRRLQRLAHSVPNLYRLYRVLALIVNPATGLARELNVFAQDQMLGASADQTKRWLAGFLIKKAGYYAIELYSGRLILREVEFTPYTTGRSQAALKAGQQRTERFEREPLRILVLGQVKAGKSSLINALFGELRAAVDVVPRTTGVEAYLLEREGVHRAILFDTAGYEDVNRTASAIRDIREEILRCDLVLLVCSALTAARDADRLVLDQVRRLFQEDPDREFPPLVVAVTHIDQLRPFRDWSPPYDLVTPATPKAVSIREAVLATAEDLQVDLQKVIPVCLQTGSLYNVDEGLIPAILGSLDTARRLKYLRCLREYREEAYWMQLREQAKSAGRILWNLGQNFLNDR